jgi:hypothetical protein
MRGAIVAVLLYGAACGSDTASLVVDVKTDLIPGVDFTAVRQVITGPALGDTHEQPSAPFDDFVRGVRVAEYPSIEAGTFLMTTQLLDSMRAVVAQRVTAVTVRGHLGVVVVIARDCRNQICPGASDPPGSSTCEGGRCVDPHCSSVDRSSCPFSCGADSDCPPRAGCAMPRCESSACLYVTASCIDGGDGPDAGALDGGAFDSGPPDAGPAGCTPGEEVGSCCNGGTRTRDVTCGPGGETITSPWSGCMDDGCGAGECCGGLRCRAC